MDRSTALKRKDVDDWWTGYAIAIPGIAGSLFSVLYFGAALWAAASIAFGRFPFRTPQCAKPFVASAMAFALLAIALGAWHDGLAGFVSGLDLAASLIAAPLVMARFAASNPRRALEILCLYAVLGGLIGLLCATWQFLMRQSIEGGAGNPSVFGFAMAVVGICAVGNLFSRHAKIRLFGAAGYVFSCAAVLLSETRAMYPVIAAAPVIAAYFLVGKRLPAGARLALIAGVAVAAVAAVALFWSGSPLFASLFQDLKGLDADNTATSLAIRMELWRAALQSFGSSIWLGHGLVDNMTGVLAGLPLRMAGFEFTHAHNVWLDLAVSLGILGPVIFTALILSPLCKLAAPRNTLSDRERYILVAMTLAVLANSFLNVTFNHDLIATLYLVPIVIVLAAPDGSNAQSASSLRSSSSVTSKPSSRARSR